MARGFNGTTDKAVTASTPVTALPLTLAGWAKPIDLSVGRSLIAVVDSTTNDGSWSIAATSTLNVIALSLDATTSAFASSTGSPPSTGAWSHWAGTFASNTSRAAFLNGANKGTDATANAPVAPNVISVGALARLTPANFMSGAVAEAAIWNVILTDLEILLLASGVCPLLIRRSALVWYSPLLGDSPEPDYSGGRRSATLTGTTVAAHPGVQTIGIPQLLPIASPSSSVVTNPLDAVTPRGMVGRMHM